MMIAESDMHNLGHVWEIAQKLQDEKDMNDEDSDDDVGNFADPDKFAEEKPSGAPQQVSKDKYPAMEQGIKEQVTAARLLLSESVGSMIKLSELCNRPGMAVLKPIFAEAFHGQMKDMHSAQAALEVLDAYMQEVDVARLENDRKTMAEYPTDSQEYRDALERRCNAEEAQRSKTKSKTATYAVIDKKCDEALKDYHERTYGQSSSSASGSATDSRKPLQPLRLVEAPRRSSRADGMIEEDDGLPADRDAVMTPRNNYMV